MGRARTKTSSATFAAKTTLISSVISRLMFLVGLGVCLYIVTGFFKFADDVVDMTPPENLKSADGIVSLTGGSRARLTEGVTLLQEKKGKRLLISGVFKGATEEEIRLIAGGDRGLYDCCVDLGKEATDTIGNATEISAWAKKYGFKRLIIITDNYHMKRSMLEIRSANHKLEFIQYPVRSEPLLQKKWWENDAAVKRLTVEYSKYLFAKLRLLIGFNPDNSDF